MLDVAGAGCFCTRRSGLGCGWLCLLAVAEKGLKRPDNRFNPARALGTPGGLALGGFAERPRPRCAGAEGALLVAMKG